MPKPAILQDEIMKIKDALELKLREVVSLVGGGGKTTLMFALANELAATGYHVVTTTTTKIMEPLPGESERLIVEPDIQELVRKVIGELKTHRHITIAPEKFPSGKLESLSLEAVAALADLKQVDYLIIEADGAARRPLKAPRDYEPVISPLTTTVIAVAGIDALGEKLADEFVFRSDVAAMLLGMPLGTAVSPEMIAKLITLPRGITKGSPPTARIVPFLNKVNLPDGVSKGRQVAREILAVPHPQINMVLLGQAQLADPIVEIIRRGK